MPHEDRIRKTIDTAITNKMIVPFAIFITGANNAPQESRTSYYLIEKFNALYEGRLASLAAWKDWVAAVNGLTEPAKNAFPGKENLHNHQDQISGLAEVYERLKQSYLQKFPGK